MLKCTFYSLLISCTEKLCISRDTLIFRSAWTEVKVTLNVRDECVLEIHRQNVFDRYRWVWGHTFPGGTHITVTPLPKCSAADGDYQNWISTTVAVRWATIAFAVTAFILCHSNTDKRCCALSIDTLQLSQFNVTTRYAPTYRSLKLRSVYQTTPSQARLLPFRWESGYTKLPPVRHALETSITVVYKQLHLVVEFQELIF